MNKQDIRFLLEVLQRADCSTGYCCCGSDVNAHTFGDGHSPVDQGDRCQSDAIAILTAALAEPSEPVAWQLGHRFYTSLKDAEYAWRNDCAFLGTSYVPEPLFTHPASNQLDEIAKVLHYPDCWDVMAYPTLEDAIIEAKSWAHCTNDDCQCPTKEA